MKDDRVEAALAHYAAIGHARSVPDDPVPANYPAQVEAELGITLPPDYRRFLATYPCTGGPDACVLSPLIGDHAGADVSVLEFDGYATGRADLIDHNRSPHDFEIPGMLVIGDDAGGNPFYLDLATSEVWYCDRVDMIPGQREGLALVGTDFADFLLRMEIDPEGDLVPEPRPMTLWQRLRNWIAP
jgi:hypothetical protein